MLPDGKSLTHRIAAHTSWANTSNRTERTAAARAGLLARFEREVDPDGTLSPAERRIRAEHARKAFYLGLAAKSAAARRRNASARSAADEAAELRAIADEIDGGNAA